MSYVEKKFYINTCDSSNLLRVQSGKINDGQGDYIIYHCSSDGRITIPKFSIYKNIFKDHIIFDIQTSDLTSEKLSSSLKKIDSELKFCFIPKTLYEVFAITAICESNKKSNFNQPDFHERFSFKPEIYSSDDFSDSEDEFDRSISEDLEIIKSQYEDKYKQWMESDSWYIGPERGLGSSFDSLPSSLSDEEKDIRQSFELKKLSVLSYRINSIIIEKLRPDLMDLSFEKFESKLNQELENFKSIISSNFIFSANNPTFKPILENNLKVDCSNLSLTHQFLYRGSNFSIDSPYKRSLSFGSSIFAGIFYDRGACALNYMLDPEKTAYCLPVARNTKSSLFNIPKNHSLTQLFGYGETFHPRTRGEFEDIPRELEEFTAIEEFENLKHKSIILKQQFI